MITKSGARFTPEEYLSDDFTLPTGEFAHDLIKCGMYTWTLLPYLPHDHKKIIVSCSVCNHQYKQKWPLNSTTMKDHFERVHKKTVDQFKMDRLQSSDPDHEPMRASTPVPLGNFSGGTIDALLGNSTVSPMRVSRRKRGPPEYQLDFGEYTRSLMTMILSNSLPLSLVDTKSFKHFVNILRADVPPVSRSTLERELGQIYENTKAELKRKLAENKGHFALTIGKCGSGENIPFLVITVHFYNNSFELEEYTIGFEGLIQKTCTDKNIYDLFMQVLTGYGIEKRILSITRDVSDTMNYVTKTFAHRLSDDGIEFNGNVQCVGKIIDLAVGHILNYTFFKENRTQKFETSLAELSNEHPEFQEFGQRMKFLPKTMRKFIVRTQQNHELNGLLKAFIRAQNSTESTRKGPQNNANDNDPSWFSTYLMIDRFVHFREEITTVLTMIYGQSSEDGYDQELFELDDKDWEYLKTVRDILDVFRASALKLQESAYPTIIETIPMVYALLDDLEYLNIKKEENPFLAAGISEARKTIFEHFPLHDDNIEANKMLYLAIVLDPRYKLGVFEAAGFSEAKIRAIKDHFFEVYLSYKSKFKDSSETPRGDTSSSRPEKASRPRLLFRFVDSTDSTTDQDDEDEFRKYFREPREYGDRDIISFYKARKSSFPIIARIARDYFAVPSVTAPVKAAYSQARDLVSSKKKEYSPEIIKMLTILKKRGIINTEREVSNNISDREVEEPAANRQSGENRENGVGFWDSINDEDGGTSSNSAETRAYV